MKKTQGVFGYWSLVSVLLLAMNMFPATGGAEASVLSIPAEDTFDELAEVNLEEIDTIDLYARYPESWTVIHLTGDWKFGPVGSDKAFKSTPGMPVEEPGLLTVENAGDDGLSGLPEELKDEIDASSKESTTDREPEQKVSGLIRNILAEGETLPRIVVLPKKRKRLPDTMYVTRFAMDQALDKGHRRCLLHFDYDVFETVYVNGRKAYDHRRNRGSWTCDISDFVRQGENTVALLNGLGAVAQEIDVLVTPVVYADRMLVTTDTRDNSLRLDAVLDNAGTQRKCTVTAKVTSYGGKEVVLEVSTNTVLSSGINALELSAVMDAPRYWSPDDPHLYEVELFDDMGHAFGKARFGFRDFRVDGGKFYLNGKRIKLFGTGNAVFSEFGDLKHCLDLKDDEPAAALEKRMAFAVLKGLKLAGLNTVLEYNNRKRSYLEACDELGLLAYVEFTYWTKPESEKKNVFQARMCQIAEHNLYSVYNHPSFVMITLSAELYRADSSILKATYEHIKSLDRQNRAVCSSSGRINIAINKKEKDATDFADDHSYVGTLKGAWYWNRNHFGNLKKSVDGMYGTNVIPLISFETLDSSWRYDCTGVAAGINRIMCSDTIDKAAYVRAVSDEYAFGDGTLTAWLVLAHGQGLRRHYSDEVYMHKARCDLWRRIVEIFRQERVLEGFGPFHCEGNIPFAYRNENTLSFVKESFPDVKVDRIAIDTSRKSFVKTPSYYMMKRCYSPEFISARWFDRNLISGSGVIAPSVQVVNDTQQKHKYTGRVLFKDATGKVLHDVSIDFGEVAPFGSVVREFSWRIPADLPTGWYRLEMFLLDGGRRASDNHYRVYVVNQKDVQYTAETNKKVAFYSAVPEGSDLPCSKSMLDSMQLKYVPLTSFEDLDHFQVLIVGANSMDELMVGNGDVVMKWIRSGGRLLSFEQRRRDYIPWIPTMKIEPASPTTAIDIVDQAHPMFNGLTQENFDTWSGPGGSLYQNVIGPMNKTVVAAAAAGYVLHPIGYVKSAVSDVSMGRGISVVCQLDLTRRYRQDAVATIVVNNLVKYILSDETGHSWRVDSETDKLKFIDPAACITIDLAGHCNAALRDDRSGNGKGGWNDGGSRGDLGSLPVGERHFEGIPFKVIDADETLAGNNCIILHSEHLPWSERLVTGIPVNDSFRALYVMHACFEDKAAGYTLVVRYEDGSEERHEMKNGMHLGSWINPVDVPQGAVVWQGSCPDHDSIGVYQTEWDNPHPVKTITELDLEGPENSCSAIIAITGYKALGEKGWESKKLHKERESGGPSE